MCSNLTCSSDSPFCSLTVRHERNTDGGTSEAAVIGGPLIERQLATPTPCQLASHGKPQAGSFRMDSVSLKLLSHEGIQPVAQHMIRNRSS